MKEFGAWGENVAVDYLQRKGWKILNRNFRCKTGEIDIIALDNDNILCFVEVKSRRTLQKGAPCEAIDRKKQLHMSKAIKHYLLLHSLDFFDDLDMRIDVIQVVQQMGRTHISQIVNAIEIKQ